eukprot:scaffold6005_cov198-Pinguiococcus_pyrenoidosus.AAC.1
MQRKNYEMSMKRLQADLASRSKYDQEVQKAVGVEAGKAIRMRGIRRFSGFEPFQATTHQQPTSSGVMPSHFASALSSALGSPPALATTASPQQPQQPRPDERVSLEDQVEKLKLLKELLTPEEFEAEKKKLLDDAL